MPDLKAIRENPGSYFKPRSLSDEPGKTCLSFQATPIPVVNVA
ncbi:MAG: hypothetical protein K0R57_1379 [Paenibacillaceae bacterium]|jgi:hypothetical protein|nr:hypothetical protein [Paenibacillaceae bacterium]